MQTLKFTLEPQTAFGTPLVGDTLFGQLCWAIAEQYGEARLTDCLKGYTEGKPFLVISDAFPEAHLPLPTLPSYFWTQGTETDRKKLKKRQWLPESALALPVREWQQHAKSDGDLATELVAREKERYGENRYKDNNLHLRSTHSQPHNSINRQTGTTGKEGFAPYESEQIWYTPGSRWQIYLLLDESRLSCDELRILLENIGRTGYGRDASVGLGKYTLLELVATDTLAHTQGNACMTLAACCPQGLGYDAAHSYYNTTTRFGRHGNVQATAGQPFKKPVLMAQTSAIFSPAPHHPFIGQGITGISASQPQAVHQGYAPILVLTLDLEETTS